MNAPLDHTNEAQRLGLTARDFWTLAEAGAFDDIGKVELIGGEIWVVNSVWSWHARTSAHFTIELGIALRASGSSLVIYGDGSVDLAEDSVPQPDISIADPVETKGLSRAAVKLAVEVSDSTVKRDLGMKARLYADADIPEYWVVDRDGGRVVQMWSPGPDGYAKQREVRFGEPVTAMTLQGIVVDTAAIPA